MPPRLRTFEGACVEQASRRSSNDSRSQAGRIRYTQIVQKPSAFGINRREHELDAHAPPWVLSPRRFLCISGWNLSFHDSLYGNWASFAVLENTRWHLLSRQVCELRGTSKIEPAIAFRQQQALPKMEIIFM